MKVRDADIAAAWNTRSGPRRADCPASERLAAAAVGSLAEPDVEVVADHLGECPDCAEEYRLALGLEEEGAAPAVVPRRARLARGTAWAGAVAAVLLLALAAPTLLHRPPATDLRYRGPADARITTLEPEGVTPAPLRRFRWQPVPGADGYDVRLYGEDGGLVWRTETTVPEAAIPTDSKVGPGRYRWMVSARRGHQVVAESALIALDLRP